MLNAEVTVFVLFVVGGGGAVFDSDFHGKQFVVFWRGVVPHVEGRGGGMMVAHRPHSKVGSDSRVPAAREYVDE